MSYTKTQLMINVALGRSTEVFAHSDCGTFDVTAMRKWAQKHLAPVFVALDEGMVKHIRESRDVDEERLTTLTSDEALYDPAMAVLYEVNGETEHLLIDGTHRILKLAQLRAKQFACYMVPLDKVIRPNLEGKRQAEWGSFQMDEHGNVTKGTPPGEKT